MTVELAARIQAAQHGDAEALEHLMTAYKPLVRSRVAHLFIPGADYEDTLQEGMIALYKAILTYDADSAVAFATYASTVIRNHVLDQVAAANRQKNAPLNDSLSIHSISEENEFLFNEDDLLSVLIAREVASELVDFIQNNLSALEKTVLTYHLSHKSNDEIAQKLKIDVKSVENALYRGRNKVRIFRSEVSQETE